MQTTNITSQKVDLLVDILKATRQFSNDLQNCILDLGIHDERPLSAQFLAWKMYYMGDKLMQIQVKFSEMATKYEGAKAWSLKDAQDVIAV